MKNNTLNNVIAIFVLSITLSGKVNSFWFLPFIFQTGLIAALSYFVAKRYLSKKVFPVLFLIVMIVYPSSFHATMEMWTFYLTGLIFSSHSVYEKIDVKWLGLIAVVAIVIYVMLFNFSGVNPNWYYTSCVDLVMEGNLWAYFARQIMAFALIFAITVTCKLFINKSSFLSNTGMHTLAIYALHCMMINAVLNNRFAVCLPLSMCIKPILVVSIFLLSSGIIRVFENLESTKISFLGKYNII